MDVRNVRVIQRRENLRFPLKTRQAIGIIGKGIGKDLERDVALQSRVVRAIDLAHSPGAERGENLIRADAGTGSEGHWVWRRLYGRGRSARRYSCVTPQGGTFYEAVGDGEGGRRRCRRPSLARGSRPSGCSRSQTSNTPRQQVLNSLSSASGQRTYEHAIREFVAWYCSAPRLAFNRTVVLRYRIHLEQRGYAPATINLRLAAVRRIAYEAADAGLLSPELAAGIRRVKGVRRIGVRLGNWLTPEQGRRLLEATTPSNPRQLRDQAMVAMLIGCGLRRAELLALHIESIQQREEHWVIADLVGKGGHVRTVPIPA